MACCILNVSPPLHPAERLAASRPANLPRFWDAPGQQRGRASRGAQLPGAVNLLVREPRSAHCCCCIHPLFGIVRSRETHAVPRAARGSSDGSPVQTFRPRTVSDVRRHVGLSSWSSASASAILTCRTYRNSLALTKAVSRFISVSSERCWQIDRCDCATSLDASTLLVQRMPTTIGDTLSSCTERPIRELSRRRSTCIGGFCPSCGTFDAAYGLINKLIIVRSAAQSLI